MGRMGRREELGCEESEKTGEGKGFYEWEGWEGEKNLVVLKRDDTLNMEKRFSNERQAGKYTLIMREKG